MFARSKRLLTQLGNPQNVHKAIHVAGTSGKGTVCYMIDAILRGHNKQTALLVSPHVYDIRERIQINNQYAPEKRYIQIANQVITHAKNMGNLGDAPSYFEVMSAIGFTLAAQKPLDYIVVETGLGGRYDLSNTIEGPLKYCVLTQIGLDHTSILGSTYEQIAREKAAIVQRHTPITALSQKKSVNKVFTEVAEMNNATISWVESTGSYEIDDLLIALDTVKNIASHDGWQFDEETAKQAAHSVYIPGRFEKRTLNNKLVVLDGAHNSQKLSALSKRLKKESLDLLTIVIAFSEHKDVTTSLQAIMPVCKRLIICEFFLDNRAIYRRAAPAESIQQVALKLGFEDIQIIKSPLSALRRALEYPESILVTGSFYLLGEIDHAF